MYLCILSTCMFVPCVFFVPTKARRGHQISWSWSFRCCEPPTACQDLNLSPLEEQPVHLPAVLFVQLLGVTQLSIVTRKGILRKFKDFSVRWLLSSGLSLSLTLKQQGRGRNLDSSSALLSLEYLKWFSDADVCSVRLLAWRQLPVCRRQCKLVVHNLVVYGKRLVVLSTMIVCCERQRVVFFGYNLLNENF